MSLFPFMDREKEIRDPGKVAIPREHDINFKDIVLTGRKVEGVEAIKLWILKVLRTKRYKHVIYTWDYGIDLEELINKPYDRGFIESEIAREIEETLKLNPYVKGISEFKTTFEKTWLMCEFVVITDFGEVSISEQYANV